MFPSAIPSVRWLKYEILLMHGRAGGATVLLFERTGHPPRREEGLPTFTLEKIVPGGIAEVSP